MFSRHKKRRFQISAMELNGNSYFSIVKAIISYHHHSTGTLITDLEGRPHQFFLNLPYGETFIEQGGHTYDNPYKFNGKEFDQETGLYYYGARYYDPKISLWLSVDPLAEKYPGMSPYNYTAGNPVRYIDIKGLFPSPSALKEAAKKLKVEIAVIWAVYKVETGGNAFRPNGEPKILFERHIFSRLTNRRFDNEYPEISNPVPGGYGRYKDQIPKLIKARELALKEAYMSVSYGGFQILGINYKRAGYDDVLTFAGVMLSKNEDKHLEAFINFILSDKKLTKSLQEKDWDSFARLYNGPNYKKYRYAEKLKAAYEEYIRENKVEDKKEKNHNDQT